MSDRSMLARFIPPWGRRRSQPVHPSIGLPADAPDYLETPNGSFVRALPESEYIPLDRKGSAVKRLFLCIVFTLGVVNFTAIALIIILGKYGMSEENMMAILIGTVIVDIPLLIAIVGLPFIKPGYRAMSLPKLLNRRRSRMCGPDKISGVMGFRHGDVCLPGKDSPQDFALFRIGDGFLDFELSRAQVRIAAKDLSVSVPEKGLSALVMQSRFGEIQWSVAVKYIEFFEWGRSLAVFTSRNRYGSFAVTILERLAEADEALTETAGTERRAAEWDPFTVQVDDTIIRVSSDGFDATSDANHLFSLAWDEVERIRWRVLKDLEFCGAGRKVVIPESTLNEDDIKRIKTRLLHFNRLEIHLWLIGFLTSMMLINVNLYLLLLAIVEGVPVKHLIVSGGLLLGALLLHCRVFKKYGRTRWYRRKAMKNEL